MKYSIFILFLLVLGCGRQEEKPAPQPQEPSASAAQTPYGSVEEVKAYLGKIQPFIQEVGKIQAEVDKVVGSSGKATGENLASVMERMRPRLKAAMDSFEKISPPSLLAPLHRDIQKLMVIRLDAYTNTTRGWQRERESGDLSLYEEAETKLKEANDLISQLNAEMKKIHLSLQNAAPSQEVASP